MHARTVGLQAWCAKLYGLRFSRDLPQCKPENFHCRACCLAFDRARLIHFLASVLVLAFDRTRHGTGGWSGGRGIVNIHVKGKIEGDGNGGTYKALIASAATKMGTSAAITTT